MTDAPPDHPGPPAPAGRPEPPGAPEPPGTPVPPDELRAWIPPEPPADAEAEDVSRLVIEAVGQLPEADRDRVYAWLLRTGMRPSPTGMPGPLARQASWELSRRPRTQTQTREWGATVVAELVRGTSSPTQQMVPVRFSAEQHTRLRAWCAEHGFSMATVIRGLVGRFLESQQP